MDSPHAQEDALLNEYSDHLHSVFERIKHAVVAIKKQQQAKEREGNQAAQQLEEAKHKIHKLHDELAEMKAERDQLRQHAKQLEGRNQHLQKSMDQVSAKLEAAIHKIGELID